MMVLDVLSGPTGTAISQTVDTIADFLVTANDVLVQKDSFKELAAYMERIKPVLEELRKEKILMKKIKATND